MDVRRSWSWEISIFKRFGLRPTLNISPNRWDQPNSDICCNQPGMQKTPSVSSWRFKHRGEEEEGLPDFAAKEVTHQNHICGNFYIYMNTLAVDHSREVTRVLMIHIKMAHLRRLGHRVGWFRLLTVEMHSCRNGKALFTEVGCGDIVVLSLKSPSTIYPAPQLQNNILIKQSTVWKRNRTKCFCGHAADYDPQLQEHREYSLCQFFFWWLCSLNGELE